MLEYGFGCRCELREFNCKLFIQFSVQCAMFNLQLFIAFMYAIWISIIVESKGERIQRKRTQWHTRRWPCTEKLYSSFPANYMQRNTFINYPPKLFMRCLLLTYNLDHTDITYMVNGQCFSVRLREQWSVVVGIFFSSCCSTIGFRYVYHIRPPLIRYVICARESVDSQSIAKGKEINDDRWHTL